jgi:hypothetical protein
MISVGVGLQPSPPQTPRPAPFRRAGLSARFENEGTLGRPSIRPDALALGRAMVKETKFFRKQAAKAERMARSVSDAEISQRFLNMAMAYRSQADVLKAKKKSGKKRR